MIPYASASRIDETNLDGYSARVFLIFVIFTLRILYFSQDIIVKQFPVTKICIIYLFESIKNISEIIINFFFSY